MSKLNDLIKNLCPDGVEFKKLGEVCEYEQPNKYIVKSTDYNDKFKTPVLTAGQSFILGYTNETDGIYNSSKENAVIIFDDFTGAFKWVDFPFKVKSSAIKMLKTNDKAILRYIFHCMGTLNFSSDEHKRLWISIYSQFKIPVPPIEIQSEIVRILDTFTALITELTAELAARKKQYEYYRDKLLTFDDVEFKPLGEICELITKGTTPPYFQDYGINFIKTEAFNGSRIDFEKISFISNEIHQKELKRSILNENDILITIAGATIGKCVIVPKDILPANTNQALAIIRLKNKKLVKYVFHILNSSYMKLYCSKNIKGSAQPNLTLKLLNIN